MEGDCARSAQGPSGGTSPRASGRRRGRDGARERHSPPRRAPPQGGESGPPAAALSLNPALSPPPPSQSSTPKLGALDIDLPHKPALPTPPDLPDKPQLDLATVKQPLSLPDITVKRGGGLPKFVKGEGNSKININLPGMKPLPDIEFEKPDPLPKVKWAKPGKANWTFQGPKQLVITKPNPPDLSITKVQPPKDKIVIAKPVKLEGSINVNKAVSKEVTVTKVNLTKPSYNFDVKLVKKDKPKVRPFFQPGNLNVSVLKFDKYEDTEYSYVKPAQNFSITFLKPKPPKWTKGENGSWTETKETKGTTFSGQLTPPGGAGPLEGALGERTVCRFRDGTNQPQFMKVVKAPAFLANKMADADLFSFIAPPYGVKVRMERQRHGERPRPAAIRVHTHHSLSLSRAWPA